MDPETPETLLVDPPEPSPSEIWCVFVGGEFVVAYPTQIQAEIFGRNTARPGLVTLRLLLITGDGNQPDETKG